MKKYKSVDAFFEDLKKWKTESTKLRAIVQSVGMDETLKWSMPVYVAGGKNVVGIFATQTYFGLWFYQGALLSDQDKVLVNAQEGKTKALRQWRMKSIKEIKVRAIKKYILEAIALAESGKEIKPNRNKPIHVPPELDKALSKSKKLRETFDALSKSRRREFAEYIAEAKKAETKRKRIEKIVPMIKASVGLNDKYRK